MNKAHQIAPCYEIFINLCGSGEEKYELTEESKEYVKEYWNKCVAEKDKNFGNGRDVRNYFEKVVKNQTNRLASSMDFADLDMDAFMRIELSDVRMALVQRRANRGPSEKKKTYLPGFSAGC